MLKQQNPELVALYTYLLVRLKNTGGVETTTDQIANDLNLGRRTVLYHKKKLIALGLIQSVRHKYYCEWNVVTQNSKFFGLVTDEENALLEYTNDLKITPTLHFSPVEAQEVQPETPEVQDESVEVQRLHIVSSTGTESSSGIKLQDTSSGNKPLRENLSDEIDALDANIPKSKFKKGKRTLKESVRHSQELKPIPPVFISDVVKFGNKFPYNDDPGWFDSFIWYWATRRFTLHGVDVMITQGDLFKMRVKLKLLFDKIVKNDFKNAENYVEWYLNSKDKFIKETVVYGFEYMVSTSAINKFLLDHRKETKTDRPLFYDDTNRHQVKGKVF